MSILLLQINDGLVVTNIDHASPQTVVIWDKKGSYISHLDYHSIV